MSEEEINKKIEEETGIAQEAIDSGNDERKMNEKDLLKELKKHDRTGNIMSKKALEILCRLMDITEPNQLKIMELINQNTPPDKLLKVMLDDDSEKPKVEVSDTNDKT